MVRYEKITRRSKPLKVRERILIFDGQCFLTRTVKEIVDNGYGDEIIINQSKNGYFMLEKYFSNWSWVYELYREI